MSRVTQGVRLITLKDEQKVATVSISKREELEENQEESQYEDGNEVVEEANTSEE